MKALSDRKNIFFGVILTYVSLGITLVASLFVTPIILNLIGDANYGLFSFCNSITSWLSLASTALGASYVFFANKEAKERGSESRTNAIFIKMLWTICGLVLFLSIGIFVILILTSSGFSKYSEDQNNLIRYLLLISGVNVAVTVFFSVFTLYNNYKKSFIFIRVYQILFSILAYIANVFLAFLTKSIISIALIAVASSFLNGFVNLVYSIKTNKMTFIDSNKSISKNEIYSIIKYSSIILVGAIIGNLDSNLDKTLLGAFVNAESVAMYQLSITFAVYLNVMAYSFTEVMRPTIYMLYRNEKANEANRLFLRICKIQSIVILFIVGGYSACGYHFVIAWIGQNRIDVFFYTIALFISNVVPWTKTSGTEALRALNMHKVPMTFSCVSISINLVLSIGLMLVLGSGTAVWACIIGTIVPKLIFSYVVVPIYEKKKISLPIKEYYLNLAKNVFFTIIAVIPSIFTAILLMDIEINIFLKVLIEGAAFVIVYLSEIFVFERDTLLDLLALFFKRKSVV